MKDLCDVMGDPDGEWDLEIEDQMIFVDEMNEQRTTNNEDKYVKIVLGSKTPRSSKLDLWWLMVMIMVMTKS